MGPTGTISANVGTNALDFKIEIVPDGKSVVGFRIKDYSFKVHVGCDNTSDLFCVRTLIICFFL